MTKQRVAVTIALGCAASLLALLAVAGAAIWAIGRFGPNLGLPAAGRGAAEREVVLPKPDRRLASKPEDPWTLPMLPVRATVLVLPITVDGGLDADGVTIADHASLAWNVLLPDGIGLADGPNCRDVLGSMSPYAGKEKLTPPANQRTVVLYAGATHWLEGSLTRSGTEWIVDATLHTPGNSTLRRFTAPAGEHFTLSSALARWMAESTDLGLSAGEIAALGRLPYGDTILGDDEAARALREDTGHQVWRTLLASPDASAMARYNHLFSVTGPMKDRDALLALDPGPLPVDAPLWQRKLRRRILTLAGENATARHEAMLLLARHPGHAVEARILSFDAYGEGEMREEFVEAMQRWHQRAPASAASDARLAEALSRSAWDYRGGGYSDTVTALGWQRFAEHNASAEQLFRAAVAKAGPIPWVSRSLCEIYGAEGERARMFDIHRATVSAFPDYTGTWSTVLWYTLPRWGGSIGQVGTLIDEAFATRPDNCDFGDLPLRIYYREAALGGGRLYDVMINYLKQNPGARPRIEEGIRRMGSEQSRPWLASRAIVGIAMLGDLDPAVAVVHRWPEVHREFSLADHDDWYGIGMSAVLYGHVHLGNWRHVDEIMAISLRDDAQYENDMRVIHNRVVGIPGWQPLLAAYADIMNGRAEQGLARLDTITAPGSDMVPDMTFLKLAAGRVEPGVRELCEAGVAAKPKDSQFRLVAALAAHRTGDAAAARTHLEAAEAHARPLRFDGMRREVRRIVLAEGGSD